MAKLVDNEQWKLTATYLNGIAIAVAATGVLGPLASQLIGATIGANGPQLVVLAGSCACLSAALHHLARLF